MMNNLIKVPFMKIMKAVEEIVNFVVNLWNLWRKKDENEEGNYED